MLEKLDIVLKPFLSPKKKLNAKKYIIGASCQPIIGQSSLLFARNPPQPANSPTGQRTIQLPGEPNDAGSEGAGELWGEGVLQGMLVAPSEGWMGAWEGFFKNLSDGSQGCFGTRPFQQFRLFKF